MTPPYGAAEVQLPLSDDHERLSQLLEAALSAFRAANSAGATETWLHFEQALRSHVEHEEQEAFPLFERSYPDEVALLALDHTRMLGLLDLLESTLDSARSLRAVLLADFTRQLHSHAARERQLRQRYLGASVHGSQAA